MKLRNRILSAEPVGLRDRHACLDSVPQSHDIGNVPAAIAWVIEPVKQQSLTTASENL